MSRLALGALPRRVLAGSMRRMRMVAMARLWGRVMVSRIVGRFRVMEPPARVLIARMSGKSMATQADGTFTGVKPAVVTNPGDTGTTTQTWPCGENDYTQYLGNK